MKRNINKILLAFIVMVVSSCEVFKMDVQDNPNALKPEDADIDFLLNSVQVGTASFFENATFFGMEVTRMEHMFGPLYNNAYSPTSFDGTWTRAYSSTLTDIQAVKPLALEKELWHHLGMAQALEAYILVNMVDLFGAIPYDDAFLGTENLNPGVQGGDVIYAKAEALLDEAIANFEKTPAVGPKNDLYYGGTGANWIKFANSMKMKMYVQTRFVDTSAGTKFAAILTSGDYIQTDDESFQYTWSTNRANPDSRHPNYTNNYLNGGNDYMSVGFMNLLQSNNDPRIRYYFYRQRTSNTTDVNEKNCITQSPPPHYAATDPFCNLSGGYWGRDHGNDDGIPPDDGKRTIWGMYPSGGLFDSSQNSSATDGEDGALGAGISPMLMASQMDFLRAEAALFMGTGETARDLFESGMNGSITKVMNFAAEVGYATFMDDAVREGTDYRPDIAAVTAFTDGRLADYDAATSDEERLNEIVTQLYVASFGNGMEPYNAYRRTGYPSNLQPTVTAAPGPFIRTFFYPSNFVNRNSSVSQKADNTTKVFWDTNTTDLK